MVTLAAESIATAQTAEKRLDACRQWLTRKNLPDAVTAFVLRTAAEIEHGRLQDEQALKDAKRAAEVFPYDLAAQRLVLELQPSVDLAGDLNLDLWTLRDNPADINTLLDVCRITDGLALYSEATPWYSHVQALLAHFRQDMMPLTLQIADHWLAAGEPQQAVKILEPMTAKADAPAEARLLLAEAWSALGKPSLARSAAAKALRSPASRPATTAPADVHAAAMAAAQIYCQNAWIRMMYLGATASQPSTAMAAASEPEASPAAQVEAAYSAFETAPDQSWSRRCYGWALLKAGQLDKSIEILKPIAQTDAWADLGLAEAYHAQGDAKAVGQALEQLRQLAPSGPAYRAAVQWAKVAGVPAPLPNPAVQKRAKELLDGFNLALLDLPIDTGKFLRLKLIMDAPPLPGEPWFGRIELTNTSSVPIYCGPYGALVPNVLLSAMVYDPATRDIGQRLLLPLQKQYLLKPGQTLWLYRPLDCGPLHQVLLNPFKSVYVLFTLILDPVRLANGTWAPGPLGLAIEPVSLTRPTRPPPRADDLLKQAQTGSQDRKLQAFHWIIATIAGRRAGPQSQPALAPHSLLAQALVVLLSDRDPLVVSHALSIPDQTPLIEPVFQAAMPRVNDPNWLVRLMAVRFFAHEQGPKFTQALKNLSRTDPDPLVRSLMAAYYAAYLTKEKG